MGSNRENSNIAIAIYGRLPFLKGIKIISHFDGSNNIFADCKLLVSDLYNLIFTTINMYRSSDYLFRVNYFNYEIAF